MLDALAAGTKALLYAGILTVAGVVFAQASLQCPPHTAAALTRVMRRGALLTILVSLTAALILIFQLGGEFDEPIVSAVLDSSRGAATYLQLVGAVLLLASFGDDAFARGTRLSYAALLLLSLTISGHAHAADWTDSMLAFVHVATAAWWIGSLWLLRRACLHEEPSDVARVVTRFSTLAVKVVLGLVAAGLMLAVLLIDFAATPLVSPYVEILFVKIGIAVAAISVATYNKFRLTPRLKRQDAAAASALYRMVNAELLLIAALLAVTAILTTYTSPH